MTRHQREPTNADRYYICRNFNKYYINFNVTGVYNKRIEDGAIRGALRRLMLNNSTFVLNAFRTSCIEEDTPSDYRNFILKPVKEIRYEDVVEWREIKEFNEQVLEEIGEIDFEMNVDKPLFKVLISQCGDKQYVTFLCDHILFDGGSGAFFHEDLIRELARGETRSSAVIFNYEQDYEKLAPLSPPVDEISDLYTTSLIQKVSIIVLEMIPGFIKNIYRRWFIKGFPDLRQNPIFTYKPKTKLIRTGYKMIKFDPLQTQRTVEYCRSQQVTLTPFIGAVGLSALQDTIIPRLANNATVQYSFESNLVYSGRRFLPDYRYGVCVGSVDCTLGPIKSIIETTRVFARQLKAAISNLKSIQRMGLLGLVNIKDFLFNRLENYSKLTLEVSNLGIKNLVSGEWQIEDLIFSQNIGISHYFGFLVVGTPTGGTNLVLGYMKEFDDLEPNAWNQFIKDFESKFDYCEK